VVMAVLLGCVGDFEFKIPIQDLVFVWKQESEPAAIVVSSDLLFS
jgi:hypothetical protein